MGRRGYVQTRPPEHGGCISDWAQEAFSEYLADAGLEISTPGQDWGGAGVADHWEIMIPEILMKNGRFRYNFGKVLRVAQRLRENPDALKSDYGEGAYGEEAAAMLEEGVETAKKYGIGYIAIDWW